MKPEENLQWRCDRGDDRPGDHVVESQLKRVRLVLGRRGRLFEPETQVEHDQQGDDLARWILVFVVAVEPFAKRHKNEEGVHCRFEEL